MLLRVLLTSYLYSKRHDCCLSFLVVVVEVLWLEVRIVLPKTLISLRKLAHICTRKQNLHFLQSIISIESVRRRCHALINWDQGLGTGHVIERHEILSYALSGYWSVLPLSDNKSSISCNQCLTVWDNCDHQEVIKLQILTSKESSPLQLISKMMLLQIRTLGNKALHRNSKDNARACLSGDLLSEMSLLLNGGNNYFFAIYYLFVWSSKLKLEADIYSCPRFRAYKTGVKLENLTQSSVRPNKSHQGLRSTWESLNKTLNGYPNALGSFWGKRGFL